MARNKNNIWYPFLKSFMTYLKNVKYPLVDSGYDCFIVDVKDGDIEDPNVLTIVESKIGYYYVKEDNTIYDQDKVSQVTLVQGDTFTSEEVTFFIASDDQYHTLRDDKWNNTILGDQGVKLTMGQFDVKEGQEEVTNEHRSNLPSIVIQMDQENNINALEDSGTDSEKSFNFSIEIMCLEDDINNNITGYDEWYRMQTITTELIYDYFESGQCKLDSVTNGTNNGFQWFYSTLIYNEYIRPVTAGGIFNTITYL